MRARAIIATWIIISSLFIPAHAAIALDSPHADESNNVAMSNYQLSESSQNDSEGGPLPPGGSLLPAESGEPSSFSGSNKGSSTNLGSSVEESSDTHSGSNSTAEESGDASGVEESNANDQSDSSHGSDNSSLGTTDTVDKGGTESDGDSSLEYGSDNSSNESPVPSSPVANSAPQMTTSETVSNNVAPQDESLLSTSSAISDRAPNTTNFVDVDSSTPHASDIEWIINQGISQGFIEADFDPYGKVTRCDMAAFLRRAAAEVGIQEASTWTPSNEDWHRFSDVNASTSHAEDILWLAYVQISTGFSDGTFRPYSSIARCDMAAFLRRFAAYIGIQDATTYVPDSSDWNTFSDVSQSTPHASDVLWLANTGISNGFSDGTFRPTQTVARCDTAAFLTRIIIKSGRSDAASWNPTAQDWTFFDDVSSSTPHAREILWLAHAEISTGYVTQSFQPLSNIARSDMAAFLRRLAVTMNVSDAATWTPAQSDWKRFSDVSSSIAHAEDILWLAHTGISTGFNDGTFRPYSSVTRCDMAAFLRRVAKLAGDQGANSWSTSSSYSWMNYTDVNSSTPHRDDIMWLTYAGISLGYSDNTFRPYASAARCDMAAFLHRLDAGQDNGGSNSTGWIVQGSNRFYVDPMTGTKAKGWQTLGGRQYYFSTSDGSMYHSGDKTIDGVLRPFASNGVCLKTGYQVSWKGLHLSAENVRLPSYTNGSSWNYVHPCNISAGATRAQCIETFINVAYEYMRAGTRWVDNNCGRPGTTVDCTGLIMEGLYACGMDLTGAAGGDYNPYSKYYWNHSFANTWRTNQTFQPVSLSEIERGDIIYWDGHAAIYLGNGQIIESTGASRSNVRIASLYTHNIPILGAARPFTK